MKSRIEEQEKRKEKQKAEWDKSTTVSQTDKANKDVEDRVAAQIASEMLKDNQKLRGVHSGASMKKIIEKEAKR